MKDHHLINLFNAIVILIVNGVCSKNKYHHVSRLDFLTEISFRHHYYRQNHLESLQQGIVPSGLKLKKKLAILPVSPDFEEK